MNQVQRRKIEYFFIFASILLFISMTYASYTVSKLEKQVKELERTLDIFDQLVHEFNCELILQEDYNLNVTNVDMIDHFKFQVTLSNGTILQATSAYPTWIFKEIS